MLSAVFLDRDGTINVDKGHIYKPCDWEWMPGAVEMIRGFNDLGFLVIVVTNQSGIARELYTHEDVCKLHHYVDMLLAADGARIDAYYYCPHHPDYGELRDCPCRKPKSGMLLKAQQDFDIDLEHSFMIGDKYSDVLAGRAAGVAAIHVSKDHGKNELCKLDGKTITIVKNLYEAYYAIASQLRNII